MADYKANIDAPKIFNKFKKEINKIKF